MPPVNPDNPLATIASEIYTLMTANESLFVSMGITIFHALALILIVWFGVEEALRSATGHGGGFAWDRLGNLVMKIAFGLCLTTYYASPIPVVGISFSHLVTDEAKKLATQIEEQTTNDVFNAMNKELAGIETPSISDLFDISVEIRYLIAVTLITIVDLALCVIIGFGYAAEAVCVLLGPILIPFFLVPALDFLFWGWFKAFLQFSFYQVVAAAYVQIFGSVLLNFWSAHSAPLTITYFAEIWVEILIVQLLFTIGLFKVPSLVGAIFSGSAGGFGFSHKDA